MSTITSVVNELNNIMEELKIVRKRLRELNTRKAFLEKEIVDFCEEKEQPGLKYKGTTILAEEREKHLYKSKKDKMKDASEVLSKYDIDNPQDVLKELMEAMKGEAVEEKKIKIKKINQTIKY